MTNEHKKEQILRAAERLFTRRRFHEVTTDQVAHEAHIGKGTLYRYFRTKEDLFFETANRGFDELCELLGKQVPTNAPFAQQLVSACVAITGFFHRRRRLFGMMHGADNRMALFKGRLREKWSEKRRALRQAIADILRTGAAQGQVRDDIPPELLASFLLGLLRTRAHGLRNAPAEARPYDVVVDVFLHGAAATAARRAPQKV